MSTPCNCIVAGGKHAPWCAMLTGQELPHPSDRRAEADPFGVPANTPGAKLDAGKIRAWLCVGGFSRALAAVADVTTKGAIKYSPNGWKEVPNGQERYMDAMVRHMLALGRGEQVDADTQCLHLAQVAWNALAALELDLVKAENHGRKA